MTEQEIERLIIDYQCHDIHNDEKLNTLTESELEMFRRKTEEFLNTQRCYKPM